ncbi:hypothetical protein SAMN05421690_1001177 [Nitrosomonas sp. Nm51]|uniref:hypothetical protein n=1 Tax=Nitrosomonas sp. Nm51 TaxID=133720 RepID=UPI0008BD9B02|nr:hypothetical protein [Nitrosomonas sp. Nm51]SEQ79446.1 hypothetical protein SAMN05421690_1001177 [Nitrosomonas sp. Nm51]
MTQVLQENRQGNYLKKYVLLAVLIPGLLLWIPAGETGVFEFISDDDEADVITHPAGYTGAGGELVVTVGITPLSPHAGEMEIPVKNAINTWNQLVPTINNIQIDDNIVPRRMFDFESVALHELGHCIGLAHPNLATESGLDGENKNYTNAVRGANNIFDLGRGADGIIGSGDDMRGDDINLHWFNKENNNPFLLPEIIDQTTYSRALDDLPPGHHFAANGDRLVSLLLGFENTETVMQQGITSGEARRTLAADDVATLRLAMSGLDRLQGTSDDYTLTLQYVGKTDNADIVLSFDDRAAFAACRITGFFLDGKHVAIQEGRISFNTGFAWFFNPALAQPVPEQPVVSILVNDQDAPIVLQSDDRLVLTVGLDPGMKSGNQTDYWVRAKTPAGDFWLDSRLQFTRSDTPVRAHGGPMAALAGLNILDRTAAGLPAGTYTVTFAVDDNRDQVFDETYQQSVSFTVLPR